MCDDKVSCSKVRWPQAGQCAAVFTYVDDRVIIPNRSTYGTVYVARREGKPGAGGDGDGGCGMYVLM